MNLAKSVILTAATAITLCVALPAGADTTHQHAKPHKPVTKAVHYKVAHVQRGHHLNVRSAPNKHSRVIDTLNWNTQHLHGAPTAKKGWVKVTTDKGITGYAYGHYLHKAK